MRYLFRIHCDYATKEQLEEFVTDRQCFVVKETDATRDHYQGIIEYESKVASLRALIKKKFPEAIGNKGYSVKTITETEETVIRYLCKGTADSHPEIVCNTLNISDIDNIWKQYWDEHKALKKKPKASKTILEKIFEEYPSLVVGNQADLDRAVFSVVTYLVNNNKPLNENTIKYYAYSYLVKNSEYWKQRYIAKFLNNERIRKW